MATLDVVGLEEIMTKMQKGQNIPENIMDAMLDAKGKIIADAQRKNAKTMLYGSYSKGITAEKVTLGKKKSLPNGKKMDITFDGSRNRGNTTTRNAEIAFINEYGKKGQPARQFVRKSIEEKADEANAAAEKLFIEWQEKIL